MEAVRDFIGFLDSGRGAEPGTGRGVAGSGVAGSGDAGSGVVGSGVPEAAGLVEALAVLRTVASTAVGDTALLGFQAASDFAGTVEEVSRVVEYLQLVAVAAVDRTRTQAAAAAGPGSSWTTGWREDPPSPGTDADAAGAGAGCVVDDGYRNTGEFLRARLRIGAAEARRRLSLAGDLLPRQGFTGEPLAAVHVELGAAVAAGDIASRPATTITLALGRVRHLCDTDTRDRMEHALTRTAAGNDPDFLARVARNWMDAIDQDGAEPSEELLRQLQGVFLRKTRHGLQHLEIFATTEQFEHLLTVMNTATNPRTPNAAGAAPAAEPGGGETRGGGVPLDLRSRPQKHLDGLVGACKAALTTGLLPAAGGLRPQVMVTIDYRDLLAHLARAGESGNSEAGNSESGSGSRPGNTPPQTGALLFTGPVTASTVRKIACDADIIPVLLGGEGQILDIGRSTRIFPPHIRKALTARDQGCAFPGCTIPAPWCEAHHITYWSRGGTTGTNNGTLLCSHHHHVIHKEHWTIHLRTGIPWFIPPPHIDPRQQPQRNHYFKPTHPTTAN